MTDELLSKMCTYLERIENLMKYPQVEPRWISIKESVPPEGIEVLLRGWPYMHPRYSVIVGFREGDKYHHATDAEWECEPLFWMHILSLPDDWRKATVMRHASITKARGE